MSLKPLLSPPPARASRLSCLAAAALLGAAPATAQLSLPPGASYVETFDAVAGGLPAGWTVRTGASASGRGTEASFNPDATAWSVTSGGFRNSASATGGGADDDTATQAGRPNRALGLRQTGSFGDPGAAFELELADTLGKTAFQISLVHQMLSVQPRSTVWTVQYSLDGSSWTDLGTYGDPGTFGPTPAVYPLGAALDNRPGPVFLRIAALGGSTGSGSRDTYAIDDFGLSWTNQAATVPVVATSPAADIARTSATLRGEVLAQGASPVSARGFVLSTTDPLPELGAPDVANLPAGTGTGSFEAPAPGLSLGTVHYFRAYAANAEGTAYGSVLSFRTDDDGYSPGNLAVLLAASSSSNNTSASVVELLPAAAGQASPLSIIDLPATGAGAFCISGSATSTGYLARSDDRTLLSFTGHNSETTDVNANTLNPRAVATLDRGRVLSLAAIYEGIPGNQTRGATSLDNAAWFVSESGGIYTNGATEPSPAGNFRAAKSFGGAVYVLRASGTLAPVATISQPSGGEVVALPGLPDGSSAMSDFYLVASGASGAVHDVLYLVETSSATTGTIRKYSLAGGTWVENGTHPTGFGGFGLAAASRPEGGAFLYLTSGNGATSGNRVLRLSDTVGHNATLSILEAETLVLHAAAAGTTLKGIDFVPEAPGSLRLEGVLTRFEQTYGDPSAPQSFVISGAGLAGAATVEAPPGFELSTNQSGPYAASVQVGGSGDLAATTLWLRLAAAAPAGSYEGLSVSASASGVAGASLVLPVSEVLRRLLTVTARNAEKSYDGSPFVGFSATISGFAAGESEALLRALDPPQLSGEPGFSGTAAGAVDAGQYAIVPVLSALSAANYSFAAADGILTIRRASQSIEFPPIPDSYAGARFPVSAASSSGQPVAFTSLTPASASVSGNLVTVSGGGGSAATIEAAVAQSRNYEAAAASRSFAIFASAEAEWRQRFFGDPATPPGGWFEADLLGNPVLDGQGRPVLRDSDEDELPDLGEFGFGLDPTRPDHRTLQPDDGGAFLNGSPFLFPGSAGGPDEPSARYVRRADRTTAGLVYTPQFSGDGIAWADVSSAGTVTSLSGGFELVELPLPSPLPAPGPALLFRVKVGVAGGAEAVSDPAAMLESLPAGSSDTWLSAPFHRDPVFRGRISSRVGASLGLARASLRPDTLAPGHYLLVASGFGAGNWYPIVSNLADGVTIDPRGDNPAEVLQPGTTVRILPYWTPESLFPLGAGLHPSPTLLPRSRLFLPDEVSEGTDLAPVSSLFLYSGEDHGGIGWRRFGAPPSQRFDETPLPPGAPFLLRNEAPEATRLRHFGLLQLAPLVSRFGTRSAGAAQDTALAPALGAPLAPGESGLLESGAFVGSATLDAPADSLLVYDGAAPGFNPEPSAVLYYYLGGGGAAPGWRALGSPDSVIDEEKLLRPGGAIVLRKGAVGAPTSLRWIYRPPYLP